jgi:hypothetical protein
MSQDEPWGHDLSPRRALNRAPFKNLCKAVGFHLTFPPP